MPACHATAITADGSCLFRRYLGEDQSVTVGDTVHKYAFLLTASEIQTAADETVAEAPIAPHKEAPREITWREVKPIAARNFRGPVVYNTYYRPSAAPDAAEHVKETRASPVHVQGPRWCHQV